MDEGFKMDQMIKIEWKNSIDNEFWKCPRKIDTIQYSINFSDVQHYKR